MNKEMNIEVLLNEAVGVYSKFHGITCFVPLDRNTKRHIGNMIKSIYGTCYGEEYKKHDIKDLRKLHDAAQTLEYIYKRL